MPVKKEEYVLLQKISKAIDVLLLKHYEIQKNITLITEVNTDFFGNENATLHLDFQDYSFKEKQQFSEERLKSNAPYYKLKQIMDYWCSLWFWDVRDAKDLPTRKQWYEDLVQILNVDLTAPDKKEDEELEEEVIRDYRKDKKQIEKQLIQALRQSPSSLFENERSVLVKNYADQYKFFHYELEFIEVFREKNGFDVAVGNPPWIKLEFEEKSMMSEVFPELEIRKVRAPEVRKLREEFLTVPNQQKAFFEEHINNDASTSFMNAFQNYPLLKGQQTNLYKCIIENGLYWINSQGFLGLIHPEGIYDDPKGQPLRKQIYKLLKYHFQFKNELMLFSEIDHHNFYGIHIYGGLENEINFISISNLFHPSTIDGCLIHNGQGEVGGFKIKNEQTSKMEWNILPHSNRVIQINKNVLKILAKTFENSNEWEEAKLVSIHSKEIIVVIEKIGKFPTKVSYFENRVTNCWHETNDVNVGNIQRETKYPDIENYEMIYSGPHFFVANPMYKSPKKQCVLNSDYDIIDFNKIDESYVARTNYTPINATAGYGSSIKGFQKPDGSYDDWFDYYKLGFRGRLSQTGERTLSGAIFPPKSGHVHSVISVIFKSITKLIEFSGLTASIVLDFYVKTLGVSGLYNSSLFSFPLGIQNKYKGALFTRTLQLNSLNIYYQDLWEENFKENFKEETWSIQDSRLKSFNSLKKEWQLETPLRNYFERRQALIEIDVITSMALDLSLEELILMYNIQFPVLQQNEDDTWYDTKGNIVFTCSKGLVGVGLDRADWDKIKEMSAGETYEHTITKSELYQGDKVTYYAPFDKCDRVEDYKRAWAHFEKRFANT